MQVTSTQLQTQDKTKPRLGADSCAHDLSAMVDEDDHHHGVKVLELAGEKHVLRDKSQIPRTVGGARGIRTVGVARNLP